MNHFNGKRKEKDIFENFETHSEEGGLIEINNNN